MPIAFFRIFVQYQDPLNFEYIGAPRAYYCPKCKHQWFYDPHIETDCLTVICKHCEKTLDVTQLFMTNFAEL